ncbi:hypothetical protein HZH66_005187 [Vespula vulgaris]|uniref:Uncharacterized protein n=1 Tax=Vespula vulgaris TaxID=7454 RepID=A0A834NBJ6_VESVU|nr:hypothetical protein HZH66_005187 [Vespula vulgaris]
MVNEFQILCPGQLSLPVHAELPQQRELTSRELVNASWKCYDPDGILDAEGVVVKALLPVLPPEKAKERRRFHQSANSYDFAGEARSREGSAVAGAGTGAGAGGAAAGAAAATEFMIGIREGRSVREFFKIWTYADGSSSSSSNSDNDNDRDNDNDSDTNSITSLAERMLSAATPTATTATTAAIVATAGVRRL